MVEAAEQIPSVESNDETTREGGVTGKGFVKGRSGNPGGRPRGLARKVREVLGDDDGETIARFWAACMTGILVHHETKPDGSTARVEEKVAMADRIAVSKLLAERGWGKPPQFAPIEDEDPLDLAARETDEIAARFDERLDELAARREAKAGAPV